MMKTIDIFVIGTLLLGTAYLARDYISRDCMKAQEYVKSFPSSQLTITKVMRGRCYLFKE